MQEKELKKRENILSKLPKKYIFKRLRIYNEFNMFKRLKK